MVVKSVSIKQPWANMICDRLKHIEFRTWKPSYRGPLLVVSSKKPTGLGDTGKSICVVNLFDIRLATPLDRHEPGFNYMTQYQAWILDDAIPVNHIPINGRLGLYDVDVVDETILEAVRRIETFISRSRPSGGGKEWNNGRLLLDDTTNREN